MQVTIDYTVTTLETTAYAVTPLVRVITPTSYITEQDPKLVLHTATITWNEGIYTVNGQAVYRLDEEFFALNFGRFFSGSLVLLTMFVSCKTVEFA